MNVLDAKLRSSRTIILGASLVVSVFINVLQGTRIFALRHNIEDLLARGELVPGTTVPKLEVSGLSGQRRACLDFVGY